MRIPAKIALNPDFNARNKEAVPDLSRLHEHMSKLENPIAVGSLEAENQRGAGLQSLQSEYLKEAGFALQAVILVKELPADLHEQLVQACPHTEQFRQLLLFGNAGPGFWHAAHQYLGDHPIPIEEHPLDQYASMVARQFMQREVGENVAYQILYPGAFTVNLQSLGQLLGWHTSSPLMIGIHPEYGLWSAYRVLMLANTDFASSLPESRHKAQLTDRIRTKSPCESCQTRDCVQVCPAQAMNEDGFDIERCLGYRKQINSRCQNTCVARLACPVGSEYRYSAEQIHYHYSQSLRLMRQK